MVRVRQTRIYEWAAAAAVKVTTATAATGLADTAQSRTSGRHLPIRGRATSPSGTSCHFKPYASKWRVLVYRPIFRFPQSSFRYRPRAERANRVAERKVLRAKRRCDTTLVGAADGRAFARDESTSAPRTRPRSRHFRKMRFQCESQ